LQRGADVRSLADVDDGVAVAVADTVVVGAAAVVGDDAVVATFAANADIFVPKSRSDGNER